MYEHNFLQTADSYTLLKTSRFLLLHLKKQNCDSRIFLYTLEIQKILNWVNLDELDKMDACFSSFPYLDLEFHYKDKPSMLTNGVCINLVFKGVTLHFTKCLEINGLCLSRLFGKYL